MIYIDTNFIMSAFLSSGIQIDLLPSREAYVETSRLCVVVEAEGDSNVIIYGNWKSSFDRRAFLKDLYAAWSNFPTHVDCKFSTESSRSSAGEITIRPVAGVSCLRNNRIRRISVVCKPINRTYDYRECEERLAETLTSHFKSRKITKLSFKTNNEANYGYDLGYHYFTECVHVGSSGGKADIALYSTFGSHPFNISLKLSNAEYVSKQNTLINSAIRRHYEIDKSESSLKIKHIRDINTSEFSITDNKLTNPKRVYLHIPEEDTIKAALFGAGRDECDFVCIVADDVFDIEHRFSAPSQNELVYLANDIICPSDKNLHESVCVCIRNADNGRKGLMLSDGSYVPQLLPTLVFKHNKEYSVNIP